MQVAVNLENDENSIIERQKMAQIKSDFGDEILLDLVEISLENFHQKNPYIGQSVWVLGEKTRH